MNNVLTLREFETIICNPEYKASDKYKYLPQKQFEELSDFVKDFTSDDSNVNALEFMKIGYKKGVRDTITISNYVGLIELPSGFQIEILPKIDFDAEDTGNSRSKSVFLKMLRSLKDFEGKSFTEASLKSEHMNLYDVFISMYIKEVQVLVKHGLRSAYNLKEENCNFFKGKLNVKKQLNLNSIHKERFYVEYDEFSVNRAENRLIKSTLLKLQKLTHNEENKRSIRTLLQSFELVEASSNFEKDFSKVKIDRNSKDYALLMVWSKIFLSNKSFSTFSGSTNSKALLFPMEKVFETYVAKYISQIFGENDWNVSTQDVGYYLFDKPRQFSLRPDIVIRKEGITIIMDTKWKQLYPSLKNNGISQADMYQMYAYSKKYLSESSSEPEVWLLYPKNQESDQILTTEYISNDGVCVHIFFVDVDNITDSIEGLLSKIMMTPNSGREIITNEIKNIRN